MKYPHDHLQELLSFVSLFSGCGGKSLGFKMAGFRELLAVDWDNHAIKTFKANFGENSIQKWDISQMTSQQILKYIGLNRGQLRLLLASPPCQDFSRTNTARTVDTFKNRLYLKTCELISEIQPHVFLIENVAGFFDKPYEGFRGQVFDILTKANYVIQPMTLNALKYDVPQSRPRSILLGVRADFDIIPYMPMGDPTIDVLEKHSLKNVLPGLVGHSSGQFADIFKDNSVPMCCITASNCNKVYTKDEVRKLEIPEMKKLFTYPKGFTFPGSYNQAAKRMGNSVAPNFAKALAEVVREILFRIDMQENYVWMRSQD